MPFSAARCCIADACEQSPKRLRGCVRCSDRPLPSSHGLSAIGRHAAHPGHGGALRCSLMNKLRGQHLRALHLARYVLRSRPAPSTDRLVRSACAFGAHRKLAYAIDSSLSAPAQRRVCHRVASQVSDKRFGNQMMSALLEIVGGAMAADGGGLATSGEGVDALGSAPSTPLSTARIDTFKPSRG